MSSEIKADKWSPASGTAGTIGDSGDTFTIPSGVTLANSGTTTGFATHVKLFSDTSVSGASLNIGSSIITSTYTRYLMIIQNLKSDSDNSSLYLRHSTDNNSSSINSLTDTFVHVGNSGGGGSYSTIDITNNLNAKLTDDTIGNGGNEGVSGFGYLFIDTTKPKQGMFKLTNTNSSHVYYYDGVYYVDSNDVVNAISIRPSGGVFDQGTVELYGIV